MCDVDQSCESFFGAGAILGDVRVLLSWQAQHCVQIWEIAGARNVLFFQKNASPRWEE